MEYIFREYDFEKDTFSSFSKLDIVDIAASLSGVLKHKYNINDNNIVSIYLPTSVKTYFISFAIINISATVNNLFYSYGSEALKTRIDIVEPDFIITNLNKYSEVKKIYDENKIIPIEDIYDSMNKFPAIKFNIPFDDKRMFMHFTSGTTGHPKVALHKREDLIGVIKSNEEVFKVNKNINYLCTADFGWVTGVYYGMFLPFFTNTKAYVIKDMDGYKLLKALRMLNDWEIDYIYTSPTFLKMALRYFKKNKTKVKKIFTVGEKLPLFLKKEYEKLGFEIIDTWWQTELGCVSVANLDGSDNMGQPLSYTSIALLDKGGNIFLEAEMIGKTGELLIDKNIHPSIMTGYYNNSKINSKKFINQFYKTGDIVKVMENFTLEYISRADDIIVIAGELVNPDEVESFLLKYFNMTEAVLIKDNDSALKLFCVSNKKHEKYKIKTAIQKELSGAMVPEEIIYLNEIPRTESGKVKKNILKEINA